MRLNWTLIPLAVAALAVGGFAGWVTRGEAPAEVKVQYKDRIVTVVEYKEAKAASFATNTLQVLPPVIKTRTIVKYAQNPGDKECKISEITHEKEDTGPGGSIATSASGNATSNSSASLKQDAQAQVSRDETRSAAPRLTLGLGAAISPLAIVPLQSVAPSVNLGVRIFKHYTLRAAVEVPPLSVKDFRVSGWVEVPL